MRKQPDPELVGSALHRAVKESHARRAQSLGNCQSGQDRWVSALFAMVSISDLCGSGAPGPNSYVRECVRGLLRWAGVRPTGQGQRDVGERGRALGRPGKRTRGLVRHRAASWPNAFQRWFWLAPSAPFCSPCAPSLVRPSATRPRKTELFLATADRAFLAKSRFATKHL
jgi:hypothetical protein